MTWHVVGNGQGSRRHRDGVWVSVEGRRSSGREGEYKSVILHITIYRDAANIIGLEARQRVMLEVGADHDVGCLRIRRAREGENGLIVQSRVAQVLEVTRAMTGFPLPPIKPRHAVRAAKVAREGEDALLIALPGEMVRDLKIAQAAALEKEKAWRVS